MLIRYEILRPSYRQLTIGLYARLWTKKTQAKKPSRQCLTTVHAAKIKRKKESLTNNHFILRYCWIIPSFFGRALVFSCKRRRLPLTYPVVMKNSPTSWRSSFVNNFFFFLGFLIFRGNFGPFPGSKFSEAQKRGFIRFQLSPVLTYCYPIWLPFISAISGGYFIVYGSAELTGPVSL